MTRFKSLFAALVGTAIMAVAPVANAQSMHIVGAGSSAQFLGTMIGISTMVSNNLSAGQCQFHWTKKNAINAHDDRDSLNRILDETNNVGIVWEANCSDHTGATDLSDVWLDAQYDSTLGVRLFSAQQTGATAGSGATVYLTAADIAGTASDNLVTPANLWADNKADVAIPQGIITFIGNASPGTFHVNMGLTDIRPEDALFDTIRAYSALNTTNYDGLGYVGPTKYIGAPIYTAQSGSTSNLTPVGFALSGGTDPISKAAVPAYTTFAIGAAPIIFVYNNAGVFNSGLADLTTGVNELGTKTGGPFALAHLFDGTTSCDTNNAAFTNGGDGLATPLTVILREPLSGTENTTEWTLFRTEDNSTDSQEKGVINPTRTPYNPLNLACNTAGTGTRQRRVGNGQVITAVNSIPHAIGYMFYSFANAASVIGTTAVNQANYQYFTLDGVDPLSLPNGKFGANTALQQLPFCSAVLCPSSSWTDGISYPNLRNGTYKSWSVYRWLIAKTDSRSARADRPGFQHPGLHRLDRCGLRAFRSLPGRRHQPHLHGQQQLRWTRSLPFTLHPGRERLQLHRHHTGGRARVQWCTDSHGSAYRRRLLGRLNRTGRRPGWLDHRLGSRHGQDCKPDHRSLRGENQGDEDCRSQLRLLGYQRRPHRRIPGSTGRSDGPN